MGAAVELALPMSVLAAGYKLNVTRGHSARNCRSAFLE